MDSPETPQMAADALLRLALLYALPVLLGLLGAVRTLRRRHGLGLASAISLGLLLSLICVTAVIWLLPPPSTIYGALAFPLWGAALAALVPLIWPARRG